MWFNLLTTTVALSFGFDIPRGPNPPYPPAEPQSMEVLYELESTEHLKRCETPILHNGGCELARRQARSVGCITQKQYEKMKEKGVYPVCNFLKKEKALLGWCSCGCFDPETLISTISNDPEQSKVSAGNLISLQHKPKLSALDQKSTLGQLLTMVSKSYSNDIWKRKAKGL